MKIYKALTIAGSDTSGGAGLEADLKTFQEFGIYGMAAITVIVAQNPHNNWSHDIYPLPLTALAAQLDTVLTGIGVDALKTGMLATSDIIELVAQKIDQSSVKQIVIDPVLACKGTDEPLNPDSAEAIKTVLAPRATLITPNVFEAKILSGLKTLTTLDDLQEAAQRIYELGAKNVLIKGGAKLETEDAIDLFYDGKNYTVLRSPKLVTTYNHGAGCTYAAAVTAGLAKGANMLTSAQAAKDFTYAAIKNGFPINQYVGPVWHGASRLCK
ncbi:MAG TPA: bifunctional hydroxymethylpyrimidine kinase/phosphomethylpyrimidine kinase [Candidatus Avacidaminococcus intestinavium]|uniref:pyridoxal kinase n=1 Tax=Candidatus Avacidaminococcus intestinavium TaxID=2840684 RepID=A0A9D1MPV8_9FIRM|nr:bifunctional hydroxymethylpyrimidine kinase/phosphomethylpyrimidine kinase [Candidatus Avacidaminococcus intestinavium]